MTTLQKALQDTIDILNEKMVNNVTWLEQAYNRLYSDPISYKFESEGHALHVIIEGNYLTGISLSKGGYTLVRVYEDHPKPEKVLIASIS